MTRERKGELEQRAERLVASSLKVNESQLEYNILEALKEVEYETWLAAAKQIEANAFIRGNDQWRERKALNEMADYCKEQAEAAR